MVYHTAISQNNKELKNTILQLRGKFQDKNPTFQENTDNSRTTHEIPGWTLRMKLNFINILNYNNCIYTSTCFQVKLQK